MRPRLPTDRQHNASVGSPTMYLKVEGYLRDAGRGLELLGVTDGESARLAGVVFRLAQRVAVDSGRLAMLP